MLYFLFFRDILFTDFLNQNQPCLWRDHAAPRKSFQNYIRPKQSYVKVSFEQSRNLLKYYNYLVPYGGSVCSECILAINKLLAAKEGEKLPSTAVEKFDDPQIIKENLRPGNNSLNSMVIDPLHVENSDGPKIIKENLRPGNNALKSMDIEPLHRMTVKHIPYSDLAKDPLYIPTKNQFTNQVISNQVMPNQMMSNQVLKPNQVIPNHQITNNQAVNQMVPNNVLPNQVMPNQITNNHVINQIPIMLSNQIEPNQMVLPSQITNNQTVTISFANLKPVPKHQLQSSISDINTSSENDLTKQNTPNTQNKDSTKVTTARPVLHESGYCSICNTSILGLKLADHFKTAEHMENVEANLPKSNNIVLKPNLSPRKTPRKQSLSPNIKASEQWEQENEEKIQLKRKLPNTSTITNIVMNNLEFGYKNSPTRLKEKISNPRNEKEENNCKMDMPHIHYECKDCRKIFENREDLKVHRCCLNQNIIIEKKKLEQDGLLENKNDKNEPAKCSECGKIFNSHENLKVHSFIHMSKNPKVDENVTFRKLDQEVFEKMAENSNQKPLEVDMDEEEDSSKESHMYYSPKDRAMKFCGKLITDDESDVTKCDTCGTVFDQ